MKPLKEGWRTTEFWVSIITLVSGLLVALGVLEAEQVDKVIGFVAAVLAGLGYSVSRGLAKLGK